MSNMFIILYSYRVKWTDCNSGVSIDTLMSVFMCKKNTQLFFFCNFISSIIMFFGSPVILLCTIYIFHELVMYRYFMHEHSQ